MADDSNGQTPQRDPQDITIIVTFNVATGTARFEGPIDNDVLCYGILERAKDLVRSYRARKRQQQKQAGKIARGYLVLPPEFSH